jgi:hypothetical protein
MLMQVWHLQIILYSCLHVFVDVHMASPSNTPSRDLRGASRTTGGVFQGHAIGNVFNFADADDADIDMIVPRTGKVHLYTSIVNPVDVKPSRVLKINVSFSMGPILKSIAAKWSPVESKNLDFCINHPVIPACIFARIQSSDICD